AEVGFVPSLRRRRNHRDEEAATRDVGVDLAIVIVAAFQAIEVEPGREPCLVHARFQTLHRGQVLARVADEDRVLWHLARGRKEALWRAGAGSRRRLSR